MIPDDEPWWMVRCKGTEPWQSPVRGLSPDIAGEAEPETLNHLDSLDFRPIGYEWYKSKSQR